MKVARISLEAEADIDGIAAFTANTWGWRQNDRYLAKLEDSFDLLAQTPSIGRSCENLLHGLCRFEVGKHVVFYLIEPKGIFVVRILHQQMIPTLAHFES